MKKEIYYKPIHKEVDVFEHCYKNKLSILLKGPTGSGKSRFIEYMANKLCLNLITVACHEETSAVDLLGRHLIQGTETIWQDGPMTKAVKEGCILYLDEIAEARPDVIVAIHSLTDHRRELYLDRKNEKVTAHPNFMMAASFNPGYQRGWKELKPSTRQRFVSLHFDYPSKELETEILMNETGISKDIAHKLVELGTKLRKAAELGLAETASTRLLVDAGKLIHSGLPHRLSCEAAIAEPLSDEREIVLAIRDMIGLLF